MLPEEGLRVRGSEGCGRGGVGLGRGKMHR